MQHGCGQEGQFHSHDATRVLLLPTTAPNSGHSSASRVVEDNSYVWQGGLLLSTSHPAIAGCVHTLPSGPPSCHRRHGRTSSAALAELSMRRGRPDALRLPAPHLAPAARVASPGGPRSPRRPRAAGSVSVRNRRPCVMTHVRTPRREDAGGWKERESLRRFGLAGAVGF